MRWTSHSAAFSDLIHHDPTLAPPDQNQSPARHAMQHSHRQQGVTLPAIALEEVFADENEDDEDRQPEVARAGVSSFNLSKVSLNALLRGSWRTESRIAASTMVSQRYRFRMGVGFIVSRLLAYTVGRLAIALHHALKYPQDVELINRLSPPERLTLIGQLWDSLDQDDLPLTPAQQSELERRLASLDVDRLEAVSWTDLKAELEQLCP